MKKLYFPLLVTATLLCTVASAQQTKKVLRKTVIDHFFTCTLDQMFDTISVTYRIPIFFNRERLQTMDVANHFFEESLQDVFKYVCDKNHLQYWIDGDGTVYILENPDELPHLRLEYERVKKSALIKPIQLAPPKDPPRRFGFVLSGRVTDQNTGESLPGAIVKVRYTDLGTHTNTSGKFTLLNVPSDTVVVDVSFVGYQPDAFRLNSKMIDSTVELRLFPSMNALNEVTVNGHKGSVLNTDSRQVSVLQLTPAALDKLPNIGERDIMRAFQLMPGVAATNESSSGAYVRGGTPDQNLVTFDGFTVYQVDHLFGFFSAFNSNAVRDVQLYKGGFSAKYGGRLSSVTEIMGKDGNNVETNFGGDLSLLSTNLYLETPVGSNSSALIAFRRSYQGPFYDKIFGQFNTTPVTFGGGRGGFGNQTTPSSYFYDVDAKYVYQFSKRNSLSLAFYNGSDNIDNSRGMNLPAFGESGQSDINITDNTVSGNTAASLKWSSTMGKSLFANTVLSYSGFWSNRDRMNTGYTTTNDVTTYIDAGTIEDNHLKDLSFKSDWEWQQSSVLKFLFGGFASRLNVNYQYTQNDTTKLISQDNTGVITGGYAEASIDPTSRFHIQPGLRATYYSPAGQPYLEPRLSFNYHLTDKINLKGATGEFYQFTKQVTRYDVTEGDRTFWVLANNSTIPVSRAEHYILGFNYETNNFLFDVEGYYKDLHNLTEATITQTNNNFGGGRAFQFNSTTSQATDVSEVFNNGNGYADGIEFLLQKKVGVYTGWISYTLAQAKDKFAAYGDFYFPAAQDITHEVKSVNMYHYERWNFAAVFIFSTGHPYTAPLGTYTLTNLDGNKTTYITISGKNAERLPDYNRLDLSATYDLFKVDGKKVGSIGLSLFNVYNHVNSWYNEYFIRDNQVITTNVKYLGFTPNITLSLRWK